MQGTITAGYCALRELPGCAPVCANVTKQMTTGIDDSYNFRVISDRITTSGVVVPDRLKALASQRREVVVNLLPASSEPAVSDERAIVESRTSEYQWSSRPSVDRRSCTYSQIENLGKRTHACL